MYRHHVELYSSNFDLATKAFLLVCNRLDQGRDVQSREMKAHLRVVGKGVVCIDALLTEEGLTKALGGYAWLHKEQNAMPVRALPKALREYVTAVRFLHDQAPEAS